MFDEYEKIKWQRIETERKSAVIALLELDDCFTEEHLSKDQWLLAVKLLQEIGRLINNIEKCALVVRCRRLDEADFRKATGQQPR